MSALIARALIRYKIIPSAPILLKELRRSRSGTPQAQQTHQLRQGNVRGKYHAIEGPPFTGPLLLIDDVLTSGATILEVCRVLSPRLTTTPSVLPLFRAPQWRRIMHTLMIADEPGIRRT